jgi:hypothetical protein
VLNLLLLDLAESETHTRPNLLVWLTAVRCLIGDLSTGQALCDDLSSFYSKADEIQHWNCVMVKAIVNQKFTVKPDVKQQRVFSSGWFGQASASSTEWLNWSCCNCFATGSVGTIWFGSIRPVGITGVPTRIWNTQRWWCSVPANIVDSSSRSLVRAQLNALPVLFLAKLKLVWRRISQPLSKMTGHSTCNSCLVRLSSHNG